MRPRWLKRSETAIIVTLITILVWLYAEGETIVQEQRTVRLQLVAAPGEELAIHPREPQVVRMTFRCATSQLRRINQVTANPINVRVAANQESLSIRDALRAVFADHAVEIVDARTELGRESFDIRAEPLVSVTMPVNVSTAGVVGMDISVRATNPERVGVTMPASLARQAEHLSLQVNMAELSGLEQMRGEDERRTLPVRLPELLRQSEDRQFIRTAESTVEVTFSASRLTDSLEVTSVPWVVLVPPWVPGSRQIEFPEGRTLSRVTLTGSREGIAEVREEVEDITRSLSVRAVVDLSDPGLYEGEAERELRANVRLINLPEGVRWSPANLQVDVTIKRLDRD
ncbi:MAG: hypothetical protein JJU36_07340 [Phycisphaeraceae bacterium]|nr:hypothetical protein [Phycisphaeraceae bacterium]